MSDEPQKTRLVDGVPCSACGILNAPVNVYCTSCGSLIHAGEREASQECHQPVTDPPEDPGASDALGGVSAPTVVAIDDPAPPETAERSTGPVEQSPEPGESSSEPAEHSTRPMATPLKTMRLGSPGVAVGARLTHVVSESESVPYPVDEEITVGRASGDITVPDDQFLSGRHFSVRRVGSRYVLTDLDSSNGTFIRIRGEVQLRPGDEILIGNQVFRFLI